jgi:hypothetical protein
MFVKGANLYKLIVAFALMSAVLGGVNFACADDICFIGTVSNLTGHPGASMPQTPENQPIIDEANAIRSAFGVASPLYEATHMDDFSTKDGNVYVSQQLIAYLTQTNGADPSSNGVEFIVAHEYAHQFQFNEWASGHDSPQASVLQNELQADVIAGTWIGIQDRQRLAAIRRQVGPSFDSQLGVGFMVQQTQQTAKQASDFMQWTSQFHGTTDQQNAAIKAGIQYGEDFYQALPGEAYKTYATDIYDFSKQVAKK